MNALQKAYVDGASMAYNDVAEKIRQMIRDAPDNIKPIMACMEPLAQSCALKADGVRTEVEHMEAPKQ